MKPVLLLSCEHGGNQIPASVRKQLTIPRAILSSHQGWDIGALAVAQTLASSLGADLMFNEITRLVIDFNRSPRHPQLFSIYSSELAPTVKNGLLDRFYMPYRTGFQELIRNHLKKGRSICHLSIHSFTPTLGHEERTADFGILYDPSRQNETSTALALQNALRLDGYIVRRNYPYRGTADGFTTSLRKTFSDREYTGLEIEINQKLVGDKKGQRLIAASLHSAISW